MTGRILRSPLRGLRRAPFRPPSPHRRAVVAVLVALLPISAGGTLGGCQTYSRKQAEARYGPTEGLLEAVAVLRRHVPDDTYRFPPATDFTGRNVYRASLLRLESLERVHPDAARSGTMDSVIAFAKGRALERLRAYELAAQHYREAARRPGELREEALSSAAITERIARAVAIGIDLVDPMGAGDALPLPLDVERVRLELDDRLDRLSSILADVQDSHYRWIVQEEIERVDVVRASYFVNMRFALPDGNLLALQALQRVATRHGASKDRLRHLLRIADLYADLCREYLRAIPPESIEFDPAHFEELSDSAIRLYELVASHDGHPAKLEAARSLEAFLALTLEIDADRFDR